MLAAHMAIASFENMLKAKIEEHKTTMVGLPVGDCSHAHNFHKGVITGLMMAANLLKEVTKDQMAEDGL